jgi:hypothetical protein
MAHLQKDRAKKRRHLDFQVGSKRTERSAGSTRDGGARGSTGPRLDFHVTKKARIGSSDDTVFVQHRHPCRRYAYYENGHAGDTVILLNPPLITMAHYPSPFLISLCSQRWVHANDSMAVWPVLLLGMQLWPRHFSNDLACLKRRQEKKKQKAIDQAAAAGRFNAVLNPSSSVSDSEGMHDN